MRAGLPSGTITFVFTDVEGSTRLLRRLGAEAYAEALATHRGILRAAFGAHDGIEVDTQGDAFLLTEEGYVGDDVHKGARVLATFRPRSVP